MDKWQKRALAKKRAREKQLRRRLIFAACTFVVLVILITVVVRAGNSKNENPAPPEPPKTVTVISGDSGKAAGDTAAGSSVAERNAEESAEMQESGPVTEVTETPEATPELTEMPEPTPEATPEPTEAAEPTPEAVENPEVTEEAEAAEVPETAGAGGEVPAGHVPDARDAYALDPSNTVWNYDPQPEKTVYLTFDDGPSYVTPMVLDVLDEYGVKATFFVTSQSPPDAHYIAEAYKRGHTIGLHSSSHSFEIYESEEHFFDDLTRIGTVVRDQIGYVPCFIRFIGGSSNEKSKLYSEGIMTKLAAEVQEKGYQYWDWNGATGDGTEVTAEEAVAEALSSNADTIVLLAHDGPLKESTAEALPAIIEGFWDRGYTFKPLSRGATVVHHEIVN